MEESELKKEEGTVRAQERKLRDSHFLVSQFRMIWRVEKSRSASGICHSHVCEVEGEKKNEDEP